MSAFSTNVGGEGNLFVFRLGERGLHPISITAVDNNNASPPPQSNVTNNPSVPEFVVHLRAEEAPSPGNKMVSFLKSKAVGRTSSVIGLGLAAWFLYAGITALDKTCNYPIPIWILVMAGVNLTSIFLYAWSERSPDNGFVKTMLSYWPYVTLGCLVTGSVWVFQSNGDVCDFTVWKTSFIYIVFLWTFMGLVYCCIGTLAVLAFCVKLSNA